MKLIFTTLLLFFSFVASFSQAQELKICEKGVSKCKPLLYDADKYGRCMRLICYDDSKSSEKTSKIKLPPQLVAPITAVKATICDNGKKRCDPIKRELEFYWECMSETCNDPELKTANASCAEGHLACKPELDQYQACTKLNCGEAKECEKSKKFCNDGLSRYWRCVYNICLGPVEHFRKRKPKLDKYIEVKDKNGRIVKKTVNRRKPVITGAFPDLRKAPKGVDAEEWIRDIPSEFMINGNPSETMRCMDSSAVMDCRTRDIRSCGCSDGTPAILINGIPKPFKVREK